MSADKFLDQLDDIGKMLGSITTGLQGNIDIIERTDLDGFVVSTINTSDMGPETAIIDENGTHPVARYKNVKTAKLAHIGWVTRIKTGERRFVKLGYGVTIDEENITIEPFQATDHESL